LLEPQNRLVPQAFLPVFPDKSRRRVFLKEEELRSGGAGVPPSAADAKPGRYYIQIEAIGGTETATTEIVVDVVP
jgi:hypothetical protein